MLAFASVATHFELMAAIQLPSWLPVASYPARGIAELNHRLAFAFGQH